MPIEPPGSCAGHARSTRSGERITRPALAGLVTGGLARAGVRGSFAHPRGDPYTEIVRAANELRAEAIVVGASTRASHRVVGSLAGRLVKHAKWPVIVVP